MNAQESLERLKGSAALLKLYNDGMIGIRDSGVLDILRERSRCALVPAATPNYVDVQAAAANQSIGYARALDELYYFRELFLDSQEKPQARADFGSVEYALSRGDITEQEADAIRTGKPIVIPGGKHNGAPSTSSK